jgi:hypothetical protein
VRCDTVSVSVQLGARVISTDAGGLGVRCGAGNSGRGDGSEAEGGGAGRGSIR